MGNARTSPPPHGRRFGRLVRQLRTARALTQERLAERADLSADTIRRLEHGAFSPSLETLFKLGVGLDTGLASLFATFEGSDDATARELLATARHMSRVEITLALRVLTALVSMLRTVDAGDRA